jgi:protein-tyrosine phosphatase
MASTYKLLFVCLGNICRSPCAEGVMRKMVLDAGLEKEVLIDSAGTEGWHEGNLPDDRMRKHAKLRGYALESRARQAIAADMDRFDLILAMDESNRSNLLRLCTTAQQRAKVQLFCDYADQRDETEVPDPYHGGPEGFDHVLDIVEDGCAGLLAHAQKQLSAS